MHGHVKWWVYSLLLLAPDAAAFGAALSVERVPRRVVFCFVLRSLL